MDYVTDDSIIALINNFHAFNFFTTFYHLHHYLILWRAEECNVFVVVIRQIIIEFALISWGSSIPPLGSWWTAQKPGKMLEPAPAVSKARDITKWSSLYLHHLTCRQSVCLCLLHHLTCRQSVYSHLLHLKSQTWGIELAALNSNFERLFTHSYSQKWIRLNGM